MAAPACRQIQTEELSWLQNVAQKKLKWPEKSSMVFIYEVFFSAVLLGFNRHLTALFVWECGNDFQHIIIM